MSPSPVSEVLQCSRQPQRASWSTRRPRWLPGLDRLLEFSAPKSPVPLRLTSSVHPVSLACLGSSVSIGSLTSTRWLRLRRLRLLADQPLRLSRSPPQAKDPLSFFAARFAVVPVSDRLRLSTRSKLSLVRPIVKVKTDFPRVLHRLVKKSPDRPAMFTGLPTKSGNITGR